MNDNAVVPIAARTVKDLGPFLIATTEDTLTLVLEAVNVVIQIDDGKWLNPELAQVLTQAVLEVWTRNIKGQLFSPSLRYPYLFSFIDPITLSVLDDLLSDLARSPAPGVYQTVVSQSLPILSRALTQAPTSESWIASSAIDLVSSLARGGTKGNLGDGFFGTFAPNLFACLEQTGDQDILEVCGSQ